MTGSRGTRGSYDAVAGDYAAEVAGELVHKPFDRGLLDAFVELVGDTSDAGAVGDIGCGPGHVGAYLAGRRARTYGIDLSPGMCAVARRTMSLAAVAGDMTALPLRSGALAGLVCMYAVIHLDPEQRASAYREFARVLGDGGLALVAFHTSDAETASGGSRHRTEWWGHDVELTFRFLDADEEVDALRDAGLELVARLDRAPHVGHEHESNRSYLVVRRS